MDEVKAVFWLVKSLTPQPEARAQRASKDGPRATAAQAAHGSRRALCALLTMRCLSDRHIHRPRPEEARSAVSKDGPRATAAQAAHGSRRALRALLTMRCSPIVLALLLLASLVAIAPAHEPDERAVAPDARAYRLTPAYLAGSVAERAGMDAEMAAIPGADPDAVELGHDLDHDGDADEIHIHLEVIEIQEEVYPGQYVTFWVFAPLGSPMGSPARLPSPTIRVEEGDVVYVTLHNTHYLPHTIHFHGMAQDNAMDGVPDMTQRAVAPGRQFTYRFVAKTPGTYWYHCHVQDHIHPLMGLAGMIIVEPNRPNNHFAHLVPGAGRIEPMAKATAEQVQGEYSLVYMDIDDRLNRIPAAS